MQMPWGQFIELVRTDFVARDITWESPALRNHWVARQLSNWSEGRAGRPPYLQADGQEFLLVPLLFFGFAHGHSTLPLDLFERLRAFGGHMRTLARAELREVSTQAGGICSE